MFPFERDKQSRAGPYPNRNPRREEAQQNAESQQNFLESSQRAWQAPARAPTPPSTLAPYLLPLYEELNLQLALSLALNNQTSEHTNPLPPLLAQRNALDIGDEQQPQNQPTSSPYSWLSAMYRNQQPRPGLHTPSIEASHSTSQPGQDAVIVARYDGNQRRFVRVDPSSLLRPSNPQRATGQQSDCQQDPPSPIRRSLPWRLLSLPTLEGKSICIYSRVIKSPGLVGFFTVKTKAFHALSGKSG